MCASWLASRKDACASGLASRTDALLGRPRTPGGLFYHENITDDGWKTVWLVLPQVHDWQRRCHFMGDRPAASQRVRHKEKKKRKYQPSPRYRQVQYTQTNPLPSSAAGVTCRSP